MWNYGKTTVLTPNGAPNGAILICTKWGKFPRTVMKNDENTCHKPFKIVETITESIQYSKSVNHDR